MPSSLLTLRDAGVAAVAAIALALAFPKIGAAWIVPFGTAALFWTWQRSSWKRAALLGALSGLIFIAIDYSWVGYTVGSRSSTDVLRAVDALYVTQRDLFSARYDTVVALMQLKADTSTLSVTDIAQINVALH